MRNKTLYIITDIGEEDAFYNDTDLIGELGYCSGKKLWKGLYIRPEIVGWNRGSFSFINEKLYIQSHLKAVTFHQFKIVKVPMSRRTLAKLLTTLFTDERKQVLLKKILDNKEVILKKGDK